jgi:hypothetical protein
MAHATAYSAAVIGIERVDPGRGVQAFIVISQRGEALGVVVAGGIVAWCVVPEVVRQLPVERPGQQHQRCRSF